MVHPDNAVCSPSRKICQFGILPPDKRPQTQGRHTETSLYDSFTIQPCQITDWLVSLPSGIFRTTVAPGCVISQDQTTCSQHHSNPRSAGSDFRWEGQAIDMGVGSSLERARLEVCNQDRHGDGDFGRTGVLRNYTANIR